MESLHVTQLMLIVLQPQLTLGSHSPTSCGTSVSANRDWIFTITLSGREEQDVHGNEIKHKTVYTA